ncbi:unnamed protein product, partial [Discosporangium mesarthrocarpum]
DALLPAAGAVREGLRAAGYACSGSHIDERAIKTDASLPQVETVLRRLARDRKGRPMSGHRARGAETEAGSLQKTRDRLALEVPLKFSAQSDVASHGDSTSHTQSQVNEPLPPLLVWSAATGPAPPPALPNALPPTPHPERRLDPIPNPNPSHRGPNTKQDPVWETEIVEPTLPEGADTAAGAGPEAIAGVQPNIGARTEIKAGVAPWARTGYGNSSGANSGDCSGAGPPASVGRSSCREAQAERAPALQENPHRGGENFISMHPPSSSEVFLSRSRNRCTACNTKLNLTLSLAVPRQGGEGAGLGPGRGKGAVEGAWVG